MGKKPFLREEALHFYNTIKVARPPIAMIFSCFHLNIVHHHCLRQKSTTSVGDRTSYWFVFCYFLRSKINLLVSVLRVLFLSIFECLFAHTIQHTIIGNAHLLPNRLWPLFKFYFAQVKNEKSGFLKARCVSMIFFSSCGTYIK